MMKAWLLFSTLALLATSYRLPNINLSSPPPTPKGEISLSLPPTTTDSPLGVGGGARASFGRFFNHQETIPFGSKMGKVIKSKQIKEDAYKLRTIVIDPGHGGYDSGLPRQQHARKAYCFENLKTIGAKN